MRLAAYAGTSVALAAAIVLKALHTRPNFYSVCVYFAESNAALMILSNLVLLVFGSILVGLQHILYGPLRPIEIETLYEKAWFAVTETCLAMTIFREELGVWFVVMFVALLVAKVWGWIGEGRLEILEQQPPENPKLFHARLCTSLVLSMLLNGGLLHYSINTVHQTNRPNMMVMFAFEFALLNVSSLSTMVRYGIIAHEALVVRDQTSAALQARRKEIEEQRKAARDAAAEAGEPAPEEPPIEEMLDEADIDVPGWEEKSRWVFYLDLTTDFLRLLLYVTFFFVLCRLYGMPIHIIRDVALVVRSFYRRVTDFIKYRHATRDMHARYPDATAEEISSQDVCIICREGMTARSTTAAPGEAEAPPLSALDERLRPKKLPCGHILHFACLRSWLERQQNCPTCRQPVLSNPITTNTTTQAAGPAAAAAANPNQAGGVQPAANNNQAPPIDPNQPNAQLNRMRTFNLGPLRLTVGTGQIVRAPRPGINAPAPGQNPIPVPTTDPTHASTRYALPTSPSSTEFNTLPTHTIVHILEHRLALEVARLQVQADQLFMLRGMQAELQRLRNAHVSYASGAMPLTRAANTPHMHTTSTLPQTTTPASPQASVFTTTPQSEILTAGSPNFPPGVTIPDGWTLLPLQRATEQGLPQQYVNPAMMMPSQQRSRSVGPSRELASDRRGQPGINTASRHAMHNGGFQLPSSASALAAALATSADAASAATEPRNIGQTGLTPVDIPPATLNPTSTTESESATTRATTNQETAADVVTSFPEASNTSSSWQWPTSPPAETSTPSETKPEASGTSQPTPAPETTASTAAHQPRTTTVEDDPDEG